MIRKRRTLRATAVKPGDVVVLGAGVTAMMRVERVLPTGKLVGRHLLGFDIEIMYEWVSLALPIEVMVAETSPQFKKWGSGWTLS